MKNLMQSGQALVEYSVVCAIVVLALLLAENNTVEQILAAFKFRLERFAELMAAP